MSIQNRLKTLYEGLAAISPGVGCYHYYASSDAEPPYIVWYEESENSAHDADNHKVRQSISGYVEFFTQTEFDSTFDLIQEFLNGIEGLSWVWEATQYGDPTSDNDNLIHYTWSWEVV